MEDPTEDIRRGLVAEINSKDNTRASLEAHYGKVWTLDELQAEFEVVGFLAPFCMVRRKSDNKPGSVEFCHMPRFYFNFMLD